MTRTSRCPETFTVFCSLLTCLLILPSLSASAEDAGILLRYKFQPETVARFEIDDQRQLTLQKQSTLEQTNNQSITKRHYKVLSVKDDGTAELQLMIDHVHMQAKFPNEEPIVFDSADPSRRPVQFKQIMDSVGIPLATITVNNRGEVLKSSAIGANANDQPDDAESFLIQFPENPVKPGDQWSQDFTTSIPVTDTIKKPIRLKRNYTVESIDGQIATFKFQTALLTPVRDPEMKSRLIDMTPDGKVTFDIQRGVITSRSMTVDTSVVGALGQGSKVSAKSDRSEKLIAIDTVKTGPIR